MQALIKDELSLWQEITIFENKINSWDSEAAIERTQSAQSRNSIDKLQLPAPVLEYQVST